ncbi:phage portal protein, partial [Methylocystis sp.]|uniref:phage portal protein n=1 Tax=Methylocystis sp. TaxID=1911079 RepID=UPI003DA45153
TNAGRPLLLEGGLDWKALSLSPKDMDFAESKAGAAREIALAFGVPPLLLGLPGDNTFSNYAEANRALWRQTVLPLVARVQKSFQAWRQPGFASGVTRHMRLLPRNPTDMSDILNAILERGDLAHLALFLWACAATAQAYLALRELGEATRRLDAFVRELARFNRRCRSDS